MSHRKEQVQAMLKRGISQILMRDLSDPRIQGLVSITEVETSQDMRQAVVQISVIPEKYEKRTIHGLNSAAKHIHSILFKQAGMRRVPHLVFELDKTLKQQAALFADIREGSPPQSDSGPDEELSSEEPKEEPTE